MSRKISKNLCLLGLFTWFILQSCGTEIDSRLNSFNTVSPSEITFLDWCAAWQLTCPTGPAENVPDPQKPWTVAEWQSALAVYKALLASPSNSKFLRSDLDDADLVNSMKQLKKEKELSLLKARLDGSKFNAFLAYQGKVVVTAQQPSDFQTKSGLIIHNEGTTSIQVSGDREISTEGVEIRSNAVSSVREILKGFSITAPNVLNLKGSTQTITGVPIKFAFTEILGIDFGNQEGAVPTYKDIVPTIAPLRDWIVKGQRDLDLGPDTFLQLEQNIPVFIPNQNDANMVRSLLKKITRVLSTAESRKTQLIKAEAPQTFSCTANGKIRLDFEKSFGLQNISKLSAESAMVSIFGIKAKLIVGPIQPNFQLTRIDLEPTKIIVRNVPGIGSYTIDMTNQSEQSSMTCQ